MAKIKTIEQVESLQKGYRVTATQESINTGRCWLMEGSVGRFAMGCIESGACVLPDHSQRDYYGNTIPSRDQIKKGEIGSLKYCCDFWQRVADGDDELIDLLEETFGRDEEDEIA